MKNLSLLVLLYLTIISNATADKINVVASCSIFADMAENIAGDLVNIQSIVPIGGDPHLHSPTPRDARIVEQAGLILINGLTFEGWISELIENSGTKAAVKLITENINPIASTEYKNSADPHAWMNASNGLVYIDNIKNALIKADPKNTRSYVENYRNYRDRITAAHIKIKELIDAIPESNKILITSHDAFSYFGNEYGLRVEPIVGISTEADVQTSDMVRVQKVISEYNVPALFVESTINPKLLEQIASDNNIEIGGELFADSLGEKGGDAGTYLDMLLHNATTINLGLSKTRSISAAEEIQPASYGRIYLVVGAIILALLLFVAVRLIRK